MTMHQETQCIFHIQDGLREGLTHFSSPSRAAVIYGLEPDAPLSVYDPQHLLDGHEPKLKDFFLDTESWRENAPDFGRLMPFEPARAPEPHLSGLVAYACFGRPVAYQMWFTEHHPDMCSIGPTLRWLEHAAGLLAQNLGSGSQLAVNAAGYVLQGYARHAVRDYIVDRRNATIGWDTGLRIYPILDAVLGISKTMEEGAWPRGRLVFVEPGWMEAVRFMIRFPELEQPSLERHKHVRKLDRKSVV